MCSKWRRIELKICHQIWSCRKFLLSTPRTALHSIILPNQTSRKQHVFSSQEKDTVLLYKLIVYVNYKEKFDFKKYTLYHIKFILFFSP